MEPRWSPPAHDHTHYYGDGCAEHPARNVGTPIREDDAAPLWSDAEVSRLLWECRDNIQKLINEATADFMMSHDHLDAERNLVARIDAFRARCGGEVGA